MDKVIHKQALSEGQTDAIVLLPVGAKIVGAGFQGYAAVFWYERPVVLDEKRWEQWGLSIRGTGHSFSGDDEYLAGPMIMGDFVFHLVGKKL